MEEELTSGEVYEEPEELVTLDPETGDSENIDESVQEYRLLSVDDLELAKYGGIGMLCGGTACLVSLGVGVLLGILRKA